MATKEDKDGLFFQSHEGFVGWAGDINQPVPRLKMYISCVSDSYVKHQYNLYARNIELQALTIGPKKADESIKDVFFTTGKSFSHFNNNAEFVISDSPINYSLVDFLNFVVDMEDENMPDSRKLEQERFLREFVGSFKGFQSGKGLGQKNPGYMDSELFDKAYFISMGLAQSPPNTIIYEEVIISTLHNHALPHGTIDLVFLVQKDVSVVVALSQGSERQAIVELLALSEVLLQSNPDLKCCVILKVSQQLCRPYFYLPHLDVLIRTSCDILIESDDGNYGGELIGSFIVSLIMHHHINMNLLKDLKGRKSGWSEAYKASGMKYNAYITPQKYSKRISKPVESQASGPSTKRLRSQDYSEFLF